MFVEPRMASQRVKLLNCLLQLHRAEHHRRGGSSETRLPSGLGLLLVGSGIYWMLSSQLIASFTVLAPQLFSSMPGGVALILIVGVVSSAAGLWIINVDLGQLSRLLARQDGWLYLIPILLGAGDLTLTLMGLSSSKAVVELNPLVSLALQDGPAVFAAFAISYMALSEGLALLMLYTGDLLFPARLSRYLPFAATCGAASFGLLSNLAILTVPALQGFSYLSGVTGGILLAALIFHHLRKGEGNNMSDYCFTRDGECPPQLKRQITQAKAISNLILAVLCPNHA